MSLLSFVGKKTTMAVIVYKLKKDFSNYKKLLFLGNILAVILPISVTGILFYILKTFTDLKVEEIILILSMNLITMIISAFMYYKRQLNKGIVDLKKVSDIAKAPVTEIKTCGGPFVRELLKEHNNMRQK
jgi:hypothetical protein